MAWYKEARSLHDQALAVEDAALAAMMAANVGASGTHIEMEKAKLHRPLSSTVAGQPVACLILGLRPGTRHIFRVTACNHLGFPAFSPVSFSCSTQGTVVEWMCGPICVLGR